ncbi:Nucleoside-diphosphate-sugar epimerase [Anaerocolumna jejuensis DSM 15929]|uniref:UDP-glucose 4-epimerase n=1 Tax=Anaerocolumna jejuensis DSM 15929 TaxID=1121322 RepID=A0A1M6TJ50_9FIRM|nr:NAD-dependent epimerase/dehydratase family protein [Anaerocolumna jejuensis]SHK57001.1 Nucleoside-diphosphate-sugar epimerase [Anaerocolumna jejuensis DSM 15929]
MKVLVLGGTRFFGIHLVEELLLKGCDVTIATRGLTPDPFGDRVKRIKADRTKEEDMKTAFKDKAYDIVYDDIAYCSNDIKYALDNIVCKRYIFVSTISVYDDLHMEIEESEFNPLQGETVWCNREDAAYNMIKQHAERALFQNYASRSAAAVRFPFVIGKDDYTKRLFFYVDHIKRGIPMKIDNIKEPLGFIHSLEAGRFLAFLGDKDFTGVVNAGSKGAVSVGKIIEYTEGKTGKKAVILSEGEEAPYNGADRFSVDVRLAEGLGFSFSKTEDWIWDILDYYILLP